MLLFGHIGITLGVFLGISYFAPRLKTIIDPRYLVIGALLPDLIDKPLGYIFFASTISNGRIISHTLLFSLTLLLIGLYLYDRKSEIRVISLALGSFFHLIEDQMWRTPQTLLWPLFGWSFPKNSIDHTGFEYLLALLSKSFHFQFSESNIPEVLGMGVVIIFILFWLRNVLIKINSKHVKVKAGYHEKLTTKTAALYVIGLLIFGFFIVKTIAAL